MSRHDAYESFRTFNRKQLVREKLKELWKRRFWREAEGGVGQVLVAWAVVGEIEADVAIKVGIVGNMTLAVVAVEAVLQKEQGMVDKRGGSQTVVIDVGTTTMA